MTSFARGGGGPRLAGLLRRLQALDAAPDTVLAHPPMMRSLGAISGSSSSSSAGAAPERAPAAARAAPARDANSSTPALVRLPSDLAGAVERFLASSGAGSKRSMSIGEALWRLGRGSNKRAGGAKEAAAAAASPPPATATTSRPLVGRTRSGRPRARDVAALEDVVAERGADDLSERDLEMYVFGANARGERRRRRGGGAGRAAPSSSRDDSASSSSSSPAPIYHRADAEAYALARLAPSYAACRAAMSEVAARLSGGGGGSNRGATATTTTTQQQQQQQPQAPPPFAPRRMLDFGAGPGTAVWAAQDVWLAWGGAWEDDCAKKGTPPPLRVAHAVERSSVMTALGRKLEEARAARPGGGGGGGGGGGARGTAAPMLPEGFPRRPAAAPVTWAPSLAALRRRASGGAGRRRYDLVTCAYVLSEELGGGGSAAAAGDADNDATSDEAGRADRTVRALWDMVAEGGVLLLVEPGTRDGSAAVLRARELVLDVALRRAAKRDRRVAAAATEGAEASAAAAAAAPEQQQQQHHHQQQQQQLGVAEEPEGGAYVVAPCPHDGPCPMQAAAAMALVGSEHAESESEDESESDGGDEATTTTSAAAAKAARGWSGAWCHFGQRLQRPPFMQRSASGGTARRTDHQTERFSYVAIRRGRRPEPLPPGHLLLGGSATASASAAEALGDGDGGEELEPGERRADVAAASAASRRVNKEVVVLDEQLLEAIDDMLPPSFGGRREDEEEGDAAGEGGDDDAEEQKEEQEGAAVLPISVGAGPGLVDRLVALDAAGVEWWRPEALAELQLEGGVAAMPSAVARPAAADAAASDEEDAAEDDDDPVVDDPFRHRREAQAALLAASRSGAAGWARLVRPPLQRGGHVVVDLCCAASEAASPSSSSSSSLLRRPSPAPSGRLVRATVTRASLSRAWGKAADGPAAYALARALRWGDAMPLPPPSRNDGDDDKGASS